jgi:hypothetical protein
MASARGAARLERARLAPAPRPSPTRAPSTDGPADQTKELSVSAFDFEEPETAKEAIDLGLVLCKQDK